MYGSGNTVSTCALSLSTVRRSVWPGIGGMGRGQTYPSPLRSSIAPAEAGRIGAASAEQLPATPACLVVSTSPATENRAFCTATTSYPSRCNSEITDCQPEASANAPCTSTMVGLAAIVRVACTVAACANNPVGCSAWGAAQPTSTASDAIFTAVGACMSPPEEVQALLALLC